MCVLDFASHFDLQSICRILVAHTYLHDHRSLVSYILVSESSEEKMGFDAAFCTPEVCFSSGMKMLRYALCVYKPFLDNGTTYVGVYERREERQREKVILRTIAM